MRRKYDFIVGIGGACCCSQALRAAGLQYASFPFDWVAHADIRMRTNQVRDDFADWLPKDALEEFLFETTNTGAIRRNVRTGIVFPHDFHQNVPFDEEWPRIAEKYRRRADRMMRLGAAAKRVLVVWVDVKLSPFATEDDCAYARDVFRRKWPSSTVELLHMRYEEGRAFADRVEREADGVRTVSFDYRDRSQTCWLADHELLGRWLRDEYEVTDYRTPEERASGRSLAKRRKYGRFHATGLFDYLRTKLEYKLFVHLRKQLSRKGLV